MGNTTVTNGKQTMTPQRTNLPSASSQKEGELRQKLSAMEEKMTSASEELQATEEELDELRAQLCSAKRNIELLKAENAVNTFGNSRIKAKFSKLHCNRQYSIC